MPHVDQDYSTGARDPNLHGFPVAFKAVPVETDQNLDALATKIAIAIRTYLHANEGWAKESEVSQLVRDELRVLEIPKPRTEEPPP